MEIPLSHFEEYIDEPILKRGLSYFKKGFVHEPEEIRLGDYEAVVEGSEEYTVKLSIRNRVIAEYSCDCPYDMGPVCEHVAAVIFYLEQEELELTQSTKKGSSKKAKASSSKPSKRKTLAQQVDELLDKVTHDELTLFVREHATKNAQFRDLLLASFAQYNPNESRTLYAKQVKALIKVARDSDKYGLIDSSGAKYISKEISPMLSLAERYLSQGNHQSAFFICTAIMDELISALLLADDREGVLGNAIYAAYDTLSAITCEEPSEAIRRQILKYCFTSFDKRTFAGWDWHIGLLQLAACILDTEGEVEELFKRINSIPESDEYEIKEVQKIKYCILLEKKGTEVAQKYLEQNLDNPSFREVAIQDALDQKDYERATALANDGIEQDSGYPGLVTNWYEWLLKIAESQKDPERIILYARHLLLNDSRPSLDYYEILRKTVPPEQWTDFVETIVQEAMERKPYYGVNFAASVFVREEWWSRLLDLVKKECNLDQLAKYEKLLAQHFPNELADLYAERIIEYVESHIGRNYYRTACKYIRKMIKLGARDKADEVISQLRQTHYSRRALMEELDNV
ncbi:SWIM zinc finger domain-containing protein [uncultured Porphyromonas sp.]|uniref:SWIM zinc finger family protein n=1 Tax=uncultured Porphyromonas sp. TaxID=159274 RepID=UPI002624C5F9|nr:SWIM zinc finger family protein [uncultured Porphyromonas sp.]